MFANECVRYENMLTFFLHLKKKESLFYLKKNFYLIVNNECQSMVFTILQGCFPYSNGNARMALMAHTMHDKSICEILIKVFKHKTTNDNTSDKASKICNYYG